MLQWLDAHRDGPAFLRDGPWVEMQLAMLQLAEETAAAPNDSSSLLSMDLEDVIARARNDAGGSLYGMQQAIK